MVQTSGKVWAVRRFIHCGQRIVEVTVRVGRQRCPDRFDALQVGRELNLVLLSQGRVRTVDTVPIADGPIASPPQVHQSGQT
ncbi:hypothetical protein ACQPXB_27880 [Amycolatopsis sp. CA-161197]|uniref:hypothetical protein n=1 Tax=Amycolatopsis sp. CA-161197 TaxID=3239922 RepID=UPI003D94FD7C